MFSKILIANRGEIAVRIIRACREMGISTVAIYSTADKEAMHVQLADESYCVGGARVADSYLNMPAILTAAVASGAQAIHPGYGLLSENAKFVKLCEECNIDFIGPTSEMINLLGDKDMARKTMREAGVPVTPVPTFSRMSRARRCSPMRSVILCLSRRAQAAADGESDS